MAFIMIIILIIARSFELKILMYCFPRLIAVAFLFERARYHDLRELAHALPSYGYT